MIFPTPKGKKKGKGKKKKLECIHCNFHSFVGDEFIAHFLKCSEDHRDKSTDSNVGNSSTSEELVSPEVPANTDENSSSRLPGTSSRVISLIRNLTFQVYAVIQKVLVITSAFIN